MHEPDTLSTTPGIEGQVVQSTTRSMQCSGCTPLAIGSHIRTRQEEELASADKQDGGGSCHLGCTVEM